MTKKNIFKQKTYSIGHATGTKYIKKNPKLKKNCKKKCNYSEKRIKICVWGKFDLEFAIASL